MIKKLTPLIYFLTPLCALAETISPSTTPGEINQISGNLNVTTDSYVFASGAGINATGGITTTDGLYVGMTPVVPNVGAIYAESGIDPNYIITAGNNISIGTVLQVLGGKNLTVGGTSGASIDLTTGAIDAIGGINIANTGTLSFAEFVASGTGSANVNGNSLTIRTGDFQSLDSKNTTVNIGNGTFNVAGGAIENKSTGNMNITAGAIVAKTITNEANYNNPTGNLNITAESLNLTGGDATTNPSFVNKGNFLGIISGATTLAHGFDLATMDAVNTFNLITGTLSLGDRIGEFYTNNLNSFVLVVTDGDIDAETNPFRNGTTNLNATMMMAAENVSATGIENSATMNIVSNGAVTMGGDVVNAGTLHIDGGTFALTNINNSGAATFTGLNTFGANAIGNLTGATSLDISAPTINASGMITNNAGTMNIAASNTVSAAGIVAGAGVTNISGHDLNVGSSGIDVSTGGILNVTAATVSSSDVSVAHNLTTGTAAAGDMAASTIGTENDFDLRANNLNIGGSIDADNITISNLDAPNGVNITVGGDMSGNIDIMGLDRMTIGGNYTIGDNSKILANANSSSNYWTDVDFSNERPVVNQLTGGQTALITVGGTLTGNASWLEMTSTPMTLSDGQFGLILHRPVTESSALWFANAADIQGEFSQLNIGFCNADGTMCVNYLDAFDTLNDTDENLPVYLFQQDNDLYVVFDSRFQTPIGLFKLQPVVGATDGHTTGEWQSAGALDDLIEAMLDNNGYTYETAVLPVVQNLFDGTPLERVDSELYARMHDYARNGNGNVIRAFSRLFQLREANQIADSLTTNIHSDFRDMSDRFIDESIWNRNRRLNKLWIDGGFGMFTNDFGDIDGDGNRFNLAFGYDWQANDTLILGWMGHGSYTNANVVDNIDLGYTGTATVAGRMESDMEHMGIGGGLYFLNTLSNKLRLYGDAMFDVNMITVERTQTWMDKIKGDATSFSAVAEFGLIHDWLNQYIIGNVYARAGYNFGFNMTEKIGDTDYMKLKFDGYPILTPGYSLTAQKRVYPSVWFEFRPYATVGIEYDLLGTPDTMKYKFALANKWTNYDIEIDPLWANAGAGIEFLWVNGLHIGLGYRYQYNENIQMHKINASFKYRF